MKKQMMLAIYVATAGIGRMGFGAWLTGEKIDRSDDDDGGTYARLPDALEAAGERVEQALPRTSWQTAALEWNTSAVIGTKRGDDIHAVALTFSGEEFLAGWFERPGETVVAESGATPSEALRALGAAREAKLAHAAWVMGQR